MHSQVDFTKGSTAKHFTCSVELSRSFRILTCLVECLLNSVRNINNLDDSGRRRSFLRSASASQGSIRVIFVLSYVPGDLLGRHLALAQSLLRDVDRDRTTATTSVGVGVFIFDFAINLQFIVRVISTGGEASVVLAALSTELLLASCNSILSLLLYAGFITRADSLVLGWARDAVAHLVVGAGGRT